MDIRQLRGSELDALIAETRGETCWKDVVDGWRPSDCSTNAMLGVINSSTSGCIGTRVPITRRVYVGRSYSSDPIFATACQVEMAQAGFRVVSIADANCITVSWEKDGTLDATWCPGLDTASWCLAMTRAWIIWRRGIPLPSYQAGVRTGA